MQKKGDFSWEQLGKILLAVVFFLILLTIVILLNRKSGSIFEDVKNLLRFGR